MKIPYVKNLAVTGGSGSRLLNLPLEQKLSRQFRFVVVLVVLSLQVVIFVAFLVVLEVVAKSLLRLLL